MIAAYADEPEGFVLGRAVEHHMLTHRSITVTASVSVLVRLLLDLYHGADLRESLDAVMERMRPPKITGRELADSYVNHKGPGNIPKDEKWLQHMAFDTSETTKELVHRMVLLSSSDDDEQYDDEDVSGFRDREASRLSTACYCEHTFTTVLYLAYKYGPDDPQKALSQNVMIGGHSTSRGAVLGAILGAAHGDPVPFADDLCAKDCIDKEIEALVATI
jgi:ADP-ribosyl-[dinitrogen reductase] hydrolase